MASVVGITLIKKFTYRGDTNEEYSNHYYLTGAIPADSAAWHTLMDALIAQEKTVYPNTVTVVRAYGYDSDAEDATAVEVYTPTPVAGTLTLGTGDGPAPGDAAVVARWKTTRTANGKAIWLRKYFHPAIQESGTADNTSSEQYAAINAFVTKLKDGSFLDARLIRSRTHAETFLTANGNTGYITTRTLKRRGKRPGA